VKRTIFAQAIVSAVLALTAAVVYDRIYFFATGADFSAIVNLTTIIAANVFVSLLAGLVCWLSSLIFRRNASIIFNLVYSTGSFAFLIVPVAATLPLSIPLPELFPGLVVPMVFFPALSWMTIDPFFRRIEQRDRN